MLEASWSGTAFRDYVIALQSNEKELSHRWRRRAFLYSQLSSLNPQLSQYNGQRSVAAIAQAELLSSHGRLLGLDTSGFDDLCRTFTLAQHEARELGLRHIHWLASVLGRKRK